MPQTQKNDKFRQKFVVFQLYSPCGELYAQTRDICFTSDMRFALLRLQGEYNITVSIIREANWRTISLRAQRVISRRAKRGISPKNARVQVHTKTLKNIFFCPSFTKNSTSFDLSNFFIHCESNGISSRISVYLIRLAEYISTRRVYHQPQAASSFAMMIYKAFALVIYKTSF